MIPPDARLGYCCKFVPPPGDPRPARDMNVTTITLAGLGRLDPAAAFDRLAATVAHNLAAQRRQIDAVAGLPALERLLRMSSDLLPVYNHPSYRSFYRDGDLAALVQRGLAEAGEAARQGGVRLGMHPSQFCVIASASPDAATNGIAEFEYHAEIMTMMGFDGGWHPHGAHVNIHGGGRAGGAEGFRYGLRRLSAVARNLITVENDELSYGLDDLLPLADMLPIVFDLHHHWLKSGGAYFEPDDPRIARIAASWRGVRPLSHISVSRETLLTGHDPATRPEFSALAAAGLRVKDLRAHSEMMWNGAINDLVAAHLAWTDFEVEAKGKNLASAQLGAHVAGIARIGAP